MKSVLALSLLLCVSSCLLGDTFNIGGKDIQVPVPKGFAAVTPEMGAVHKLSQQMKDTANDLLAHYIPEKDAEVALKGGMPVSRRWLMVKVLKTIKGKLVSPTDFADLKRTVREDSKKQIQELEKQFPGIAAKLGKGISEQFNVDMTLSAAQMVPLDIHYEAGNAFAYSMYMKMNVAVGGRTQRVVVAGTATFVNAAGKVLFLYSYGMKPDLKWTRDIGKAWAEKVIESNPPPPAQSVGLGGSGDRSRMIVRKALIGGAVGAVGALLIAMFSKLFGKGR